MAVSSAIVVGGFICKVMVLNCSLCLISLGPLVIFISASELVGIILPSVVAMGRSSILWVERIWSVGPLIVRSRRSPSTVISATLNPSLKASSVSPNPLEESLLSAIKVGLGFTRISGAPRLKDGRGLIRVPSRRGRTLPSLPAALWAIPIISSRFPPETSRSIDLEPPIPRPKIDLFLIIAKVFGSE